MTSERRCSFQSRGTGNVQIVRSFINLSAQLRPGKRSGSYHILFRYHGKQTSLTLGIVTERETFGQAMGGVVRPAPNNRRARSAGTPFNLCDDNSATVSP